MRCGSSASSRWWRKSISSCSASSTGPGSVPLSASPSSSRSPEPRASARVGEREAGVGLLVQQILDRRQERHLLLLHVPPEALGELEPACLELPPILCLERRAEALRGGADRGVLFGQQLCDVTLARFGQAREQLGLLEFEVMRHLLRQGRRAAPQQFHFGWPGAGASRLLEAVPERERRLVLLVQTAANLPIEVHAEFSPCAWPCVNAREPWRRMSHTPVRPQARAPRRPVSATRHRPQPLRAATPAPPGAVRDAARAAAAG